VFSCSHSKSNYSEEMEKGKADADEKQQKIREFAGLIRA
jgi:hypothetical protein